MLLDPNNKKESAQFIQKSVEEADAIAKPAQEAKGEE